MSDGDALLAAIIAHPAEDTPRLAYADWLDENGDADRAEFVRVQVAVARLEADEPKGRDAMWLAGWRIATHRNEAVFAAMAGEPCRCVLCLREREAEAWDAYCRGQQTECPDWPVALWCPPDASHLTYRRGFVEAVRIRAEDWLAHGDRIRTLHPVTRVVLTTWPEWEFGWRQGTAAFRGRPQFHSLRGLHEAGDVVALLLREEWPGVVSELPAAGTTFEEFARITRDVMTDAMIQRLAIPPHLAGQPGITYTPGGPTTGAPPG